MKNNQTIKLGFWKRLKISIFNVENYDIFASEKLSKALGYFIKLIIVFSIIVAIGFTYKFAQIYIRTLDCLENEIPDFEYSEEKLSVQSEEEVIIEDKNVALSKIIIDDTQDTEIQEQQKEKMRQTPSSMLFLIDGVYINLPNQEEPLFYNYQEIFQQFGLQEFTKQDMIDYINNVNEVSLYTAFFITTVIYLFSIYVIFIFMDVIILSILGFFTSRIAKMKLKSIPIMNIAIYSITLSVLLNAVYLIINIFTGFEIQYFRLMYNAIAYIYVVTAILMIRTEMIKQQIELVKLANEQQKVKEELEEEQERQKQKEKEQENKPKQEEKQEDNKENKSKKKNKKNEGEVAQRWPNSLKEEAN